MRCSCRVLVVGFPYTRRPLGSNILGELNFPLLPSVQDPESSSLRFYPMVCFWSVECMAF